MREAFERTYRRKADRHLVVEGCLALEHVRAVLPHVRERNHKERRQMSHATFQKGRDYHNGKSAATTYRRREGKFVAVRVHRRLHVEARAVAVDVAEELFKKKTETSNASTDVAEESGTKGGGRFATYRRHKLKTNIWC